MKTSNLLMLLAAMYAGQAVAVDAAVAPGADKAVPAAKPKAHKHKKDCVEKDGKPCHLHKLADSSASKRAEPEEQAKAPPDIMKAAGSAGLSAPAALAAPVAAVAKPEVKSEAAVSAVAALALAKKNNCLVCHAIDKKLVGPAWKEVAAKYRGDASAESRLVNKIAKGGVNTIASGGVVWGSTPMPAHPQISEADRRTLAKFVLNLQ